MHLEHFGKSWQNGFTHISPCAWGWIHVRLIRQAWYRQLTNFFFLKQRNPVVFTYSASILERGTLPGCTARSRIYFRPSAESLSDCTTTGSCLDECWTIMLSLAPAETQPFIAMAITNAKGPWNNNSLFIDASRMLQCCLKPAKNPTAFSTANANLGFLMHADDWKSLRASNPKVWVFISPSRPLAPSHPHGKGHRASKVHLAAGDGGSRGPAGCKSHWKYGNYIIWRISYAESIGCEGELCV